MELAAEWAWPEDAANPLSHLTLLTRLDLSGNELTHLGCDVLASLRSLTELVVADNHVTSLEDLSMQCAGLRLARLDVSENRLTQLIAQSLSSLSGLQQLEARANPLQCDGDAACIARREFRRWLNATVDRVTLLRHPDDEMVDHRGDYFCQDTGASYVSGPLDCEQLPASQSPEHPADNSGTGSQYTGFILVSISAVTVLLVASLILAVGLVVRRCHKVGVTCC